MLDVMRRGQRWFTAFFVLAVGAVFVFYLGGGGGAGPGSSAAPIRVGPLEVDAAEFYRTRDRQEEMLRKNMGAQFESSAFADLLDEAASRQVVEQALYALEADALGLRVAKRELEQTILDIEAFRGEEGRFDKELFDGWVEATYGSERAFREAFQRSLLADKLMRLLRTQARVSEGEARSALERELEATQLAWVVIDLSKPPADFRRDEAAIDALLAGSAAEVEALYESRRAEFELPERVRARHILLRVPSDASEEQVRAIEARSVELRQRLAAGEDFAKLAGEFSEDPGSAQNGGDLGFFERGQMTRSFEDAAFALPTGELSEPVRSEFGYHLIRVEEHAPAVVKTYAEVQRDLAHDLLAQRAAQAAGRALAESLAEKIREGSTLETAARDAGLTLERGDRFQRSADGHVPGIGVAPDLMAAAFGLETGQSAPRSFEVEQRLVLIQCLARETADPELVASKLEEKRENLRKDRSSRLIETWSRRRREALSAAGELQVDYEALGIEKKG